METGGHRTEAHGHAWSAKSGGDQARCNRDFFPAAARGRDRSRVEAAVISDVGRLRGRRRKAEELGDGGFRGAQERGDQRRPVEAALAGGAHDTGEHLLGCARRTGEGWPVRVRREEGITNHLHPESCAGRREAAGEALTGARTGRAIEHRQRACLERRDCPSGRRPHRHHRNG